MSVLGDRLLAVHAALDTAGIAHAFGGAIALAYCTEEPRATRDLDVNVFVEPARAPVVFEALPDGVAVPPDAMARIEGDGQARLWWDDTPIDLFFDVHDFHREAGATVRIVPFGGVDIPVLDCTALAVFKLLFNRTRDWADIEAMVEVGAFDATAVLGWAVRLFGGGDARVGRLSNLVD